MTFAWTPHRFAGGALALDVANTVILRFDPEHRTDRLAVERQFADFPAAASKLSAEAPEFGPLAEVPAGRRQAFLDLREAIDTHFRHRVVTGEEDSGLLADLLERIAAVIRASAAGEKPVPVDVAAARSALRLVASPEPERLKICRACGWLFLDRSRNRSRQWCDMAVCGNRAKARLHYKRKRKESAS